jgi:bacillithiol biosynthesis cysteine-adding enzyme BshC
MTIAPPDMVSPDITSIRSRAQQALVSCPGVRSGSSAVVTTGQQVGLFTGPLLTTVKTAALLDLKRCLEAEGLPVEALFWCASEDHDLAEVTRVYLPGPDGPRDLGPEVGPLASNRRPVGALDPGVDLGRMAEEAIGREEGALFASDAREFAAIAEGRTFHDGFVRSLSWLLGNPPLLFADAAAPGDKPALVPLAIRVVRERETVRAILDRQAAELVARGLPLQVTAERTALPLFAIVGTSRLLIREEAGVFTLKGDEGGAWTEAEVVARFTSGEWAPSFSALTRPLAVSWLHPVAASVLGPAEVAYWRQMLPLFGWAGLVPPVIVPRPSVVLLGRAERKMAERVGVPLAELLAAPEKARRSRAAERHADLLAGLGDVERGAREGLEALRPSLVGLDASLGKGLDATAQNVTFSVGKLRERVLTAAARADEAFGRDLDRLLAALLPAGKLAERVYSPLVYLPRHGRERLREKLLGEVRWSDPGPQVIEL